MKRKMLVAGTAMLMAAAALAGNSKTTDKSCCSKGSKCESTCSKKCDCSVKNCTPESCKSKDCACRK